MDTIKINDNKILMIAHRGVSGLETENTIPAFLIAGEKSYYGIETDVHVTKDGKYIVCHDDNIERVTGVNMVIEESNYEDLKKQKILDSTRNLVLPDLKDYIEICKKYEKTAILELKNAMNIKDIIGIVILIKKLEWYERTIFISFSKDNIINLKMLFPDAEIQFLTGEATDEVLNFLMMHDVDLDIHFKALTKEYVEKLHANKIKVNCWTVDNASDAFDLIEMGVDMITTNILE